MAGEGTTAEGGTTEAAAGTTVAGAGTTAAPGSGTTVPSESTTAAATGTTATAGSGATTGGTTAAPDSGTTAANEGTTAAAAGTTDAEARRKRSILSKRWKRLSMNSGQTMEDLAKKHGLDTRNGNDMRKLHVPPQSKRIKRETSETATPAPSKKPKS